METRRSLASRKRSVKSRLHKVNDDNDDDGDDGDDGDDSDDGYDGYDNNNDDDGHQTYFIFKKEKLVCIINIYDAAYQIW